MKGNFHPLARILRRGTPSLASLGLLMPFAALANPSGADIVHGNVGISSPTPGGLVIDQTSHAAIINWQQFSIGDGEYVLFNQPSASAAVLNRVLGGSPSEILGDLGANGRVFLINPQGVMFGADSHVDVGSLVVSTHDLADQDFLAGRYVFAGSSNAAIDNAGTITSADGGFVVLAAEQVSNSGLIQARLGEVVLAAGSGMRFELDTGGLVNFQIDAAAVSDAAGVSNLGDIVADGGNVLLSARVARDLASTAVNNSGRIQATGVEEQDGAVYLIASGGNLDNSGQLDVSGSSSGTVRLYGDRDVTLADGSGIQAQGGDGGRVLAIAEGTLVHAAESIINVSAGAGSAGGGFVELSGHGDLSLRGDVVLGSNGHLLIDPTNLIVGDQQGDSLDFATLENLLQNNPGARVELIASDLIQIRERAGAQTLNGRDTNGNGASLFMGIGYSTGGGCSTCSGEFVSFSSGSGFDYNSSFSSSFVRGTGGYIYIGDSGSDDKLDIAGDITLITGDFSEASGVGQIQAHAALSAGGAVQIEAIDDIVTGSITAGVPPQPTGNSGEGGGGFFFTDGVTVTPGLASGEGLIKISSATGSINTGTLEGDFVELDSGYGDINVHGSVDAGDYFEIYSGRSVTIDGAVNSGGAVVINADGDGEFAGIRVDGDIAARGTADLFALSGDIDLASVAVTQSLAVGHQGAGLAIQAWTGEISVLGDLSATADAGVASVNLNGSTGVRISGGVLATGVQQAVASEEGGSQSYFNDDAARIYISSSDSIEVGGVLRSHGLAGTVEGSGEGGEFSSTAGAAEVSVYGGDIDVGGLDVSGVGLASVWLDASDGNVRVGGPATIRAEAGSEETVDLDGTYTLYRAGTATLNTRAHNGEVSTQGISVTGTLAGIGIDAQTLRIGSGSDGAALTVIAAGDAETEGQFEQRQPTGPDLPDAVSTSDYGLALIVLSASGGDDSTPGIAIDGNVTVEGPSALTALLSDGDILVDGSIDVSALGYTDVGDENNPLNPIVQTEDIEQLFGIKIPRLESGVSNWGEAALSIVGHIPLFQALEDDFTSQPLAGDVTVTGDILVSGRGQARAQVAARSLDVEGPNGVLITAALGQLAGLQDLSESTDSPSLLRLIGGSLGQEGVDGVASYSDASFTLKGDGSSESAFDSTGLQVSGGTAQVVVDDVRSVRLGALSALGGRGEQTPVYAEVLDLGEQGGSRSTEVFGGLTTVSIDTGPSGGIEILGPTVVEGTGATALVLLGGSVQLGAVSVTADRGFYESDNPDYVSDDISFGDAAVFLSTYSTDPVTVSSLTAIAEGDLHLGTRLDASGDVLLEAGGAIDNVIPGELLAFVHPLSNAVAFSSQDQVLPPTDISARNITVSFTQAPDLQSLSLAADETLALDGNGSFLNLDNLLNLSGNSLSLIDIEISSQSLQLAANQDLSIIDSQLFYSTGTFNAGRNILVDNSALIGQSHALQAGTSVQISGASSIDGGEGSANSIGVTATSITITGSQLNSTELTLAAPTLTVDASTLRAPSIQLGGDTVTLSSSNLFGNTITANPTTSLTVNGGRIAGGAETPANAVTLTAPMIQILGGATLDAGTLTLGGATTTELTLNNATLKGALSAQATDGITLNNATLSGTTGSLTQSNAAAGVGIDIRNTSLGYSDSLLLNSARALFIDDSTLGAATGTADLTLSAGGALTLSTASLIGDQVSIEGESLALGGSIDATQLSLEATAAMTVGADESLLIEAGAIDAIAEMIDLEGSTLAIGNGAAINGIDTSFLEQVPSELRASSLTPNASFIASGPDGVSLGTITLEGGYLYVRAASATATQIGVPEGRLFFNYRPFEDDEAVELPTESGLNIEAIGATLAVGGTGYTGDITILQPPVVAAKETETFDYVFLTGGSIFNPNTLNTSGDVIFVGGTVINEPGAEEPTEPAEQAANAQSIASNLSSEMSDERDDPSIEIALIEEESSQSIVEEFQCR